MKEVFCQFLGVKISAFISIKFSPGSGSLNKEKTRGTLSEEITNMTAIFKAHEGCQKPRTVLIEGDPGMGKTTYCQKLAYDWANRREEWDESFPEIELLLLLRCHDIETNIWEAIDEQILPKDVDKESKENFFKFIRENQSKVLLVLDGLDEVDPSQVIWPCTSNLLNVESFLNVPSFLHADMK